ncbi:YceI family protein [Georgenia thermotolerans]|uniref:Polyisoprenoid-binding protein n=1 Tax=Georgenia thermotolerans TaxID=527326 RepID=A0A7J5UQ54_9MICO|nr:YceI family protein [Georgenia thermotolerans]KAE8764361.1 polyisoprenoid-binding protein [Georgenia thermotolerans]
MATVPAGSYVIDGSHTDVAFTVRHAGISKVRGKFEKVEGTITVGENLADSAASVTIDAASINTGDANRDGHLRSADFWDAESKPTWTFVSTGVEGDGEEFVLKGDLTINGVTNPVALDAEFNGSVVDAFGSPRIGFSATTEISRKEFGLTWNAAMETGGFLVGDKVKVQLEIEATPAQA